MAGPACGALATAWAPAWLPTAVRVPVAGVTLTSLALRWWPRAAPAVRAAFLLSNDLAVLLLREQLTDALGTDPLSGEGMSRWGQEMLVIYGAGLLAPPPGT